MGGGGPTRAEKARLRRLQALQSRQSAVLRRQESEAKQTKAARRRARVAAQGSGGLFEEGKRTLG